jgi:5-methylcytosine-specific restriction endonuclease McrA
MKTILCKNCKHDVPEENYSLRLSNGKLQRYGKNCDDCRKALNYDKFRTEEFKTKNRVKQNKYNKKRFFYSRATTMLNRMKKNNSEVSYSVDELTKYLSSLWKKQNGGCVLSGDKLTRENAQVDHIITKYNNGGDEFENFRWITKECNQIKGSLNDEELKLLIMKIYNNFIINF